MQTFTLACFWFAIASFVYSSWLNWWAYKRWQRQYTAMLRDDYLREFPPEEG